MIIKTKNKYELGSLIDINKLNSISNNAMNQYKNLLLLIPKLGTLILTGANTNGNGASGSSNGMSGLDKGIAIASTATNLLGNAINLSLLDVDTGKVTLGIVGQQGGFTDKNMSLDLLSEGPLMLSMTTAKDFRNGSGDFMNALTSGAQGAATGATVGGGWGAAAGAIVGIGSSIIGSIIGNNKAKKQSLKANELIADTNSFNQRGFENSILNLLSDNDVVISAAYGGNINTKLYKVGDILDLDNNDILKLIDKGYQIEYV